MMRLCAAMLVVVLLVSACRSESKDTTPVRAEVDAPVALARLVDAHFERVLELNPLTATYVGDNRYNDRLEKVNSPGYRAAATALDEEFLQGLLAIDRGQLDCQGQPRCDLYQSNRERSREGNRLPPHLQPVNKFCSLTSTFVRRYAQSPDSEPGLVTDPYRYCGGRNAEPGRSIRRVVDTGSHAKGRRQQQLDYTYANAAGAEVHAVAEAERRTASPGQAPACKTGQPRIRDIRSKTAFQTQVLRDGARPSSMLESKIDRRAEARVAGAAG